MNMPTSTLSGLRVKLDPTMVTRHWEFPYDRFCEYDKSDEWWARKYGYGREVVEPSKEAIQIGGTITMHPATWEVLTQYMKQRKEQFEEMVSGPLPGTPKRYVHV